MKNTTKNKNVHLTFEQAQERALAEFKRMDVYQYLDEVELKRYATIWAAGYIDCQES